jgi:hypothetical protein
LRTEVTISTGKSQSIFEHIPTGKRVYGVSGIGYSRCAYDFIRKSELTDEMLEDLYDESRDGSPEVPVINEKYSLVGFNCWGRSDGLKDRWKTIS